MVETPTEEVLTLAVALRRLQIERDPGHVGEGNVDRYYRERRNHAVEVVLTALASLPASPPGWRLVPVEPNEAMVVSGMMSPAPAYEGTTNSLARQALLTKSIYQAMLQAAPSPPLGGDVVADRCSPDTKQ